MDDRQLMRHSPLADQVGDILLDRIAQGEYPPMSRLPSESALADEFGVSRATIRSALSTLAANGLVKRRHGTGTFVSQLTQIANPLNEVVEYRDLIEGQGFVYQFDHLSARILAPEPEIARALNLKAGALALEVHKAFMADGELLIYTVNVIPAWVFEGRITLDQITAPGATEPLFEFLGARCGQHVEAYLAAVRPDIARNVPIADPRFPIDPITPVLVIEEVGYNADERAVLFEVEYLFGDRMKFELVRHHRSSAR